MNTTVADAIIYAIRTNDNKNAKRLIKYAIDADIISSIRSNERNYNILHLAVRYSRVEIVELLLEKKCIDINAVSDIGSTALGCSLSFSNIGITEMLINHGANVNILNRDDKSVLMYACRERNYDFVSLLFKLCNNVNVNAQDRRGYTALHYATIIDNNVDIIHLLLDNGADKHIKNADDQTAEEIAIANNNNDAARVIRDHELTIHHD